MDVCMAPLPGSNCCVRIPQCFLWPWVTEMWVLQGCSRAVLGCPTLPLHPSPAQHSIPQDPAVCTHQARVSLPTSSNCSQKAEGTPK